MDLANRNSEMENPSYSCSGNRFSFIAQGMLFLAALMAVFFAGGPHQGAMGIFLTMAGCVLIFFPVRLTLPPIFWGLALCFILAVSLAILPEKWVGLPEEWKFLFRDYLPALPGFSVPTRVTPDLASTVFWILVLSSSVLTSLYSLSSPLSSRELRLLALIACMGCTLYAVVASIAWTTGWKYPFFTKESWLQPAFGFFPNRNHTAGFLLTGVILALGIIKNSISGGRIFHALIGSSCFILLAGSLLFFSISRGGLVFLIAGVVIWVLGLGRERSLPLLIFGGIIFSLMLFIFLRSEGGVMGRLHEEARQAEVMRKTILATATNGIVRASFNPRRAIQQDTLEIIFDHPLSGTGLGSYALIYPFYADKSLSNQATAIHAESDWLTFCAEGGIPALALALFMLGGLCRGIPGLVKDSGRSWPVRWAFLSAFFAELLHGFVDVPLHRPELGWWIMLLGGVGFSGGFARSSERGGESQKLVWHPFFFRIQRSVFIAGGLGMVLLGIILMRAQWGGGSPLPPYSREFDNAWLMKLSLPGDEASARLAAAAYLQAIENHPLDRDYYYQLALLSLQMDKNPKNAELFFDLERRISPNDPSFVFAQGRILADADPDAAAAIWNEALRRQLMLDKHPSSLIARVGDLYDSMIGAASGHPALFSHLSALVAYTTPELRMKWYERPECDPAIIAEALNDRSFMEKLSASEQGHLIDLWYRHRGKKEAIEEFLGQHPEYRCQAAATSAALLASDGRVQEACLFLVQTFHLQMPEKSDSSLHAADSDVPEDSLAAASYYMTRGNQMTARRLLEESLAKDGVKAHQGKALFLLASLDMQVGNWNSALKKVIQFLHATDRL